MTCFQNEFIYLHQIHLMCDASLRSCILLTDVQFVPSSACCSSLHCTNITVAAYLQYSDTVIKQHIGQDLGSRPTTSIKFTVPCNVALGTKCMGEMVCCSATGLQSLDP